MTKYRNSNVEREMEEVNTEELIEKELALPAQTVEDETFKKRYGDLRRHMAAKEAEQKTELEELRRQLQAANTGSIRMPKSEAEVDEWSKQYPDFRATLDTIINKEVNAHLREHKEKVVKLEESQKEVTKDKALISLKRRHPDAEDLFRSTEFRDWLKNQSKRDYDAIVNGLDVDDAAFVIDKYKLKAQKNTDNEDYGYSRDAAKVVRAPESVNLEPTGDYDFSESQIENMTAKQYESNEEKIMTAIRKGRFNYDLSGGAR